MKGHKGKIHRHSLIIGSNFQLALLIGLGGFHLALLLTGFSLESCLPPLSSQRNRSTTRTKVYLSKSHLLKSCNQWLRRQLRFNLPFVQILHTLWPYKVCKIGTKGKHSWTKAFPGRNDLQKSGWRTKRKHFKNYKTAKKCPSGFENLRIQDTW